MNLIKGKMLKASIFVDNPFKSPRVQPPRESFYDKYDGIITILAFMLLIWVIIYGYNHLVWQFGKLYWKV